DALVGEGTASTDAVANAVVKCADAIAKKIFLGGVDSQRVIGHLAEIETLAIEINLAAVHAVFFEGELCERVLDLLHVGDEEKAHKIESEAVDLVLLGVQYDGVGDELAHHLVFWRSVRAAATG